MTYLKRRFRAFGYAFNGLAEAFVREAHIKIHCISAVLVISGGLCFAINGTQWLFIALAICLVFVTELLNTALEKLSDMTHPQQHPTIKYIKDVSAAAVLLAVIFAIITGIFVFWPYLKEAVSRNSSFH